jgi:hypothetical protein
MSRRGSCCRRCCWSKRRCCCRSCAGATAAAIGAMQYVREELERRPVQASYTPDLPCSKESCLVRLPVGCWQVRRRGHPGSSRPGGHVELIYQVGRVEETTPCGVSTQRIQLACSRVVGNAHVCPALGERRAYDPHTGR